LKKKKSVSCFFFFLSDFKIDLSLLPTSIYYLCLFYHLFGSMEATLCNY
jgi:hypothetical protein